MSTYALIAIMMALGLIQRFLYVFEERCIENRREAIVSGVIRGQPASTQDRWLLVYGGWLSALAGAVGGQLVLSLGWLILGQSIAQREARLFVYVVVFFTWVGVVSLLFQGVMSYTRFRSVLRDAQTD
ncbi:MAG: hypothetical protein JSW51_10960 [Gemmatimonadota bacterium]|nr:MAG: hypothetical protein JSW51_10960 [Gemmatimonadota bacterium]